MVKYMILSFFPFAFINCFYKYTISESSKMEIKQRTLVILKPEVLEQNIIGNVMSFFDKLKIVPIAMKVHKPTMDVIVKHYYDVLQKVSSETAEDIIQRMTRGSCIFIVYEDVDVIKKVRDLIGSTEPEKANKGTIRKTFGNTIRYNVAHGSDSVESAEKEIKLWFSEL